MRSSIDVRDLISADRSWRGECGICVPRRKHDERYRIALAVTQFVQQFEAGTRGQRDIEHGDVEVVGGECPARLVDRIDRHDFGLGAQRAGDDTK